MNKKKLGEHVPSMEKVGEHAFSVEKKWGTVFPAPLHHSILGTITTHTIQSLTNGTSATEELTAFVRKTTSLLRWKALSSPPSARMMISNT